MRVLVAVCALAAVLAQPSKPVFPNTYTLHFDVSLPYADIEEPIDYWYDGANGYYRADYYGGLDSYIFQINQNLTWKVFPLTANTTGCYYIPGPISLQSAFPDLTPFSYQQRTSCNSERSNQCDVWQYVVTQYNRTSTYTFWMGVDNPTPIRYTMMGYDSLFGSHYDEYIVRYGHMDSSPIDMNVFNSPVNDMPCPAFGASSGPAAGHRKKSEKDVAMEWHGMNPANEIARMHPPRADGAAAVDHIDTVFAHWMDTHDKQYESDVVRDVRKQQFHANLRYINTHNRQQANKGYTLALNPLADRTRAELSRHVRNTQRPPVAGNGANAIHSRKVSPRDLPTSVDWRTKGAVTAVKDQGICGSCWSFGSHEAIEGALFVQTGKLVRLSAQALMDCSWAQGNTACDGGLDFQAYQWALQENGGRIPTEESYPYIMANGRCHADRAATGAVISGYVNVTSGDEGALQDALYTQGPISVAIDASQPDFTFYSSGVYYNPNCGNTVADLDHSVLAVGYGTWEDGQDYWIVKNSWSTHWGDQGFVYMSRKDNNCGVATSPTYVTIA